MVLWQDFHDCMSVCVCVSVSVCCCCVCVCVCVCATTRLQGESGGGV
jgi:hypothetical protein